MIPQIVSFSFVFDDRKLRQGIAGMDFTGPTASVQPYRSRGPETAKITYTSSAFIIGRLVNKNCQPFMGKNEGYKCHRRGGRGVAKNHDTHTRSQQMFKHPPKSAIFRSLFFQPAKEPRSLQNTQICETKKNIVYSRKGSQCTYSIECSRRRISPLLDNRPAPHFLREMPIQTATIHLQT